MLQNSNTTDILSTKMPLNHTPEKMTTKSDYRSDTSAYNAAKNGERQFWKSLWNATKFKNLLKITPKFSLKKFLWDLYGWCWAKYRYEITSNCTTATKQERQF